MPDRQIEIRGVRVNNLQDVDLDIPYGQLVSICGVSGSGKSSLAFDTLYSEGQRRYFESLPTYTRQFLEQLDRPDCDRIDGMPPAIAVRAKRMSSASSNDRSRTTVGMASEILPYLRLLFAKIGQLYCPTCNDLVECSHPDDVISFLKDIPAGTKFQIAFVESGDADSEETKIRLRKNGLRRLIANGASVDLESARDSDLENEFLAVVDRLVVGDGMWDRARDSLETAFRFGNAVAILWPTGAPAAAQATGEVENDEIFQNAALLLEVDGRPWWKASFNKSWACANCQTEFPQPEANLFSFQNPIGACDHCNGTGVVSKLDSSLIFPDDSISIADGAIAPWNTPAYEHERTELLKLAVEYDVDVNVPIKQLAESTFDLIWTGVPEKEFGGLNGYFAWLEKRKYKVQIATYLKRWKSTAPCESCNGSRLKEASLAYRIANLNVDEICNLEVGDAVDFFDGLSITDHQREISSDIVDRIRKRLTYLSLVGLRYLTLNRVVSSLSTGESQRVMLTKVMGSTLTRMLYVLDEPSSGLHPSEVPLLVDATQKLNDRGNTVIVVDHDETMIQSAERVVEIGPSAGVEGGTIIFDGDNEKMLESTESVTGQYISRKGGLRAPETKRRKSRGRLTIHGATGNNLKHIDVEFPLRCLCAVSGVSGSGKSTLVHQTLYPAICHQKEINASTPLGFNGISGTENFDEVVLVDQSPIGRSSSSNPVTSIKAFDEIRKTFAETVDAKARSFKQGHFSFNVDGGRCEQCRGDGFLTIDMQFMPNITVTCEQCQGTRFRAPILEIRYRSKNIADILNMTAREAFGFFRGQKKVQTKLKALIDVGLDYICLGQPAASLSSGEAQRLKLAHFLNAPKSKKALFLMDEPTFGLHMRDILRLVDCFDTLLAAGHSIIVIEHNLQLLKHADWIIDLGPGASKNGGQIVTCGTPESVSKHPDSITGKFLDRLFAEEHCALSSLK